MTTILTALLGIVILGCGAAVLYDNYPPRDKFDFAQCSIAAATISLGMWVIFAA